MVEKRIPENNYKNLNKDEQDITLTKELFV